MVPNQDMALPLPVVLALLALMASAVGRGFFGAPARRQRPLPTIALLGLGLLALPVSMGCVVVGQSRIGLGALVLGVLLFSLAAHLLRAPDSRGDEEGGGGGGGPPRPEDDRGPGGVDWDAFDRERERWDAPRPLEPA